LIAAKSVNKSVVLDDKKSVQSKISLNNNSVERVSAKGSVERISAKGSIERVSAKGSVERISAKESVERAGSVERPSAMDSVDRRTNVNESILEQTTGSRRGSLGSVVNIHDDIE